MSISSDGVIVPQRVKDTQNGRLLVGAPEVRHRSLDWSSVFLGILFVAPVASQFAQFLRPNQAVLGAQPLSVVVQVSLIAISILAWLRYRSSGGWSKWGYAFFATLLITWAVTLLLTGLHKDLVLLSVFVLPISVVMLLLKRPSEFALRVAGDMFAWSLVVVASTAQILDVLGIRPLKYEGWNRTWIQVWDAFPFLFNFIDYGSRWEGPFGNVNFAGPVGAFLVVYGATRRRISGWALMVAGLVILFVSDSRSAWVSALVAVLTLAAFSIGWSGPARLYAVAASAVAGGLVLILVAINMLDDAPSGRGSFWRGYVEQWMSYPVAGVGGRGIQELIDSGLLPVMATHGHNFLVDPLLRFGLLGTLGVVACFCCAAMVVLRASPDVKPAAAAMLTLVIVTGISEDLVSWTYMSIAVVPLLYVGIVGGKNREKDTKIESRNELGV